MMRLRTLALPCRDSGCIEPIAKACNETPNDKLWETIRGALQDRTDNHDRRADEYRSSTPERIADPDTRNGA